MAMVGNNMANSIVDALDTAGKLSGLSTADKDSMKADMTVYCDAMIQYIKDNMEINGVTVDATGVISSPITPVPVASDGGTAILTTMISNSSKDLVQNNGGTGRVS